MSLDMIPEQLLPPEFIRARRDAEDREIAERIQAETETKRLQRRMELILESAGEGIFGLDIDGKVTFVNKAAALMLGWEADDLIGQAHHALIHHRQSLRDLRRDQRNRKPHQGPRRRASVARLPGRRPRR